MAADARGKAGPARAAAALLLAPALAACAAHRPALVAGGPPRPDDTSWAFEKSDIPVEAGYRFGRLDNGMRYVVRRNARPAGTVLVRLDMAVGSLDEGDDELGYAHFVEHMAFNGSTHVPEGTMIPLLEREGLAFGADTNASTNFDRTLYKLDLPRSDTALLDTALMLMRETAGELTISDAAVARERGVILSEMRDRNSFALRDTIDSTGFLYPGSRFAARFPVGTPQSIETADGTRLRAFYRREYVPAHATLVVIGDVDPDAVERAIRTRFTDWQAGPAKPQPDAGPIRARDHGRTAIYVDPAVSERVSAVRNGPWLDEPDSVATRREDLLRGIGYAIINRRLQRLSRQADPPFRGAGFGTGDVFESARSTRLIVDTVDRKWRRGLIAAAREYRRALRYGFGQDEVAEQLANVRTALEDADGAADTRSNGAYLGAVLALLDDRVVPSRPADALARFRALAPSVTPDAVLAALNREALTLDEPLLRLRTRSQPAGGEKALRAAWREAMRAEVSQASSTDLAGFAYTDFGPAGVVASDTRETALGIRKVVFANGVMLNIKRTDLEKDRVRLSLSVDGGERLDTLANPLANEMLPYLDEGGLGRHSADQLQSILAGHTVGAGFGLGETSFDAAAGTTPRDLELQLQLWAAFLTDPGYRAEGETQYRHQMNNYFEQLRATPGSALRADLGGIVSGNDPRFSLHEVKDYRALTYARLRQDIADRLQHGAIEIGLVGDIDEDQAIALVAATFGALPARERAFGPIEGQQPRRFATDRSPRIVRHTGPADQAMLRWTWPTRDDRDARESLALDLFQRVMKIELTDELREALGKAYSPSASSAQSREWTGWGTFAITTSVDVADVPATRAAVERVLADLRAAPPSADVLERARAPMIEALANGLKTNGGWLSLVDRAQSQPDRIARYEGASAMLSTLKPADMTAIARRYLAPGSALEIVVLPEGVPAPR